jgi:YidC/Oxa1 family membrane protein insertase
MFSIKTLYSKLLALCALLCLANYTLAAPIKLVTDNTACAVAISKLNLALSSEQTGVVSTVDCNDKHIIINFSRGDKPLSIKIKQSFERVAEKYTFYGLASYYNDVAPLWLVDGESTPLDIDSKYHFTDAHYLAIVGRFAALIFNAPGAQLQLEQQDISLSWPDTHTASLKLHWGNKEQLSAINSDFAAIKYYFLPDWLAALSSLIAWLLEQIQQYLASHWALAIMLFALLLKILLFPLSLYTKHLQNQVAKQQTLLLPRIAEIKREHKGEEAHNMIMQAYKDLNMTPFYALKPFLGVLIQLPVLIAVFDALAEMPQLDGVSFLWIANLAYPDNLVQFSFSIPWLGNSLNLLPLIMTLVTITASMLFSNQHAPDFVIRKQRIQLYLMASGFLILFYPFPAAMVLYWTTVNLLQLMQQECSKIRPKLAQRYSKKQVIVP